MIKKFFNMFAGKGVSNSPEEKLPSDNLVSDSDVPAVSLDSIVNFVEYVVKSLVESQSDVRIELKSAEKKNIINIHCKKEDIGKVIGKNGKTIMAIRTLVSCAGSRANRQINVEVVDQVAN